MGYRRIATPRRQKIQTTVGRSETLQILRAGRLIQGVFGRQEHHSYFSQALSEGELILFVFSRLHAAFDYLLRKMSPPLVGADLVPEQLERQPKHRESWQTDSPSPLPGIRWMTCA